MHLSANKSDINFASFFIVYVILKSKWFFYKVTYYHIFATAIHVLSRDKLKFSACYLLMGVRWKRRKQNFVDLWGSSRGTSKILMGDFILLKVTLKTLETPFKIYLSSCPTVEVKGFSFEISKSEKGQKGQIVSFLFEHSKNQIKYTKNAYLFEFFNIL